MRDLIPPDLDGALNQAQIIITNYHAFLLRDAKEIKGVSKTTRQILLAGKSTDPFKETPEAMVTRVLRDFGVGVVDKATGRQEIVVLNDEAHHCYQDKPIEAVAGHGKITAEQAAANEDARVWFKGIQAINRRIGVKQVYDLSATPFYLSGSGYNEGFIFPWTVSDFSLMDAIESGIVKVPQTPVDDDAAGDLVTYLRLWDHIGDKLPQRKAKDGVDFANWPILEVLEGALRSLYRSYQRSYAYWREALEPLGQTPPVYIVVCPNTVVSKLVYDWIAGSEVDVNDKAVLRPGNLELFSNVVDGELVDRPRTILVDSAQLESGEALRGDFKTAAATEIAAFKNQYRLNNPGADADLLIGEDLKKTGAGNLFTVFGEPDIELRHTDEGQVVVELRSVDVYDPTTGEIRTNDTGQIALWMIDTNYDEESFFVRHCYFTGGNDPYRRLKTALKADIDVDAWASLNRTQSRPFAKPVTGKIAVKVINDYGDEVMKVFEL